ncbi:hypothetical protein Scep_018301 [Stephania cephalantha]|uniref:Uncharacterized protein n=1 Tax=Stephania cephalantha TaxID=152367 RepID=A0AAP0IR58_9MAGN
MAVKVIEESRISSPQHSTPPETSLPLTFFDVIWMIMPPVKRLFFYEFHHSNQHFIETVLPHMKHSLSQALQLFYPFAGHLITPDYDHHDSVPEIACSDGDSITLTVAETDFDFKHLSGHHARDVTDFFPLVPKLALVSKSDFFSPLMAIQVTLFTDSSCSPFGISIGITYHHVVADGKIFNQFIKCWASISKFGFDEQENIPFFDRSVIKDPNGLCALYLKQLNQLNESIKTLQLAHSIVPVAPIDKVRATFVLGRLQIEKLKQWIAKKMEGTNSSANSSSVFAFHLSTFVIASAYVWVCLTKSQEDEENEKYFAFSVDCRDRLDPPIPKFYFGNCLLVHVVKANKSDLIGENGIFGAAEIIGTKVQKINEQSSILEGAETFVKEMYTLFESGARVLSVAGSPKFKVYETDFGWGRPKKVEVVSIEDSGAMSLFDSRDDENGGVEVAVVLSKLEMDAFASLFEDTVKILA